MGPGDIAKQVLSEDEWTRIEVARHLHARAIQRRRRRLGRDGFALGTMAIPSRHARYPTRNSR